MRDNQVVRSLGVVTTSFPQHDNDMAGRFVHTHVRGHLQGGATRVHVVAIGPRDESWVGEALQVMRIGSRGLFDGDGAPEVWDRSRGQARGRILAEALRVTAALTRAVSLHARSWDAVESHWLVPSSLSVAQAAPGLFHRAFAHSGDVAWLSAQPGGATLARWLVRRLNEVVCVSEPLAERLRTLVGHPWPPVKLTVQAMPVDGSIFAPAPIERARQPLVVGVGRLVPIKSFDTLVLAVGGLPASLRPRLMLLGEGQQRSRLAALAARVGVTLLMPGAAQPAEVAEWLGRAAACVVCSRTLARGRTEGAPLVLREALAVGTKVVTTLQDLGADLPRENIVIVPPQDVPALRAALYRILRRSPTGA